jgi:putative tryptophan/tyrosine transport system substrate-binding protein
MRRRDFIKLIGGAATWPAAAWAQQSPAPVVGFLRDTSADGGRQFAAAFRQGLRETGFVEGQNVTIDYRWSDGQSERLPALAADLVRRRVSLIVGSAIGATLAAKAATSTIPIVFALANDPVAFGLVVSLARPGGNLTGVSYMTAELGGKRLGLLHELVPTVTHVAVLTNASNPNSNIIVQDVEAAARIIGLRSETFSVANEHEIELAFAELNRRRVGALLLGPDPLFISLSRQIVELAARHAVPTIYTAREFVEAGGLLSYGASLPGVYRQTGVYAGRILKGEKPAELPVLLPTTFEMVVNLKTAKALGLDIAPTLVARADEVIE